MDQTFFNVAITVLSGLAGWWMNVMWQGLKDLEKADKMLVDRVSAIDLLVAGQYVKRDYFESKIDGITTAIFAKLDRIEDKLDGKADKGHA
jgi:hypothetical protein